MAQARVKEPVLLTGLGEEQVNKAVRTSEEKKQPRVVQIASREETDYLNEETGPNLLLQHRLVHLHELT